MKRLLTVLVAAAFATACAVEVGTTQEEVGADEAAFEFEVPMDEVDPEGPGSCVGWSENYHPGYVVVTAECPEGLRYIYLGDPWVWQQGESTAE
jgi:hypothetical protein